MSVFSKKKIVDFMIYGFGQAINIVSPLFVMPYIIYVCGVDGLGKVGTGMSMALILNGIVDYGSYINGVREISINRNDPRILEEKFHSIYLSKLILLFLVTLVISATILLVPFFSSEKELYFLSLTIVVGQFINPAWFFQGIENFKWISFVNILSKIIYILLVFAFINKKSDYILVNLFLGIGAIFANAIGLLWLIFHHSFSLAKSYFKPAFSILKDEFSFSFSQFFLSLYQFFPIMLISYIAGDFIAGQFRIIDQIVSLFKTYLNMFFYFVYANICFEINKEIKKGITIWKQYNGFNFLIITALLILFYFNSSLILNYFKVPMAEIDTLSNDFKIALLIPLLVAVSQPLRQLMFAFNENKIYIKITIICTIVNLILLVLLSKNYGLKGAFISIIIIEVIIIVLYWLVLSRYFKKIAYHGL